MAAPNDQQRANVTINGTTVSVPRGLHTMRQLAAYLGVPTTSLLTVTDPTPRSAATFGPNSSVVIQGGETITSA